MNKEYESLIKNPRPLSPCRGRMSRIDRAAQFAPFAALTGYDEEIKETARLTDSKIIPDECEQEILNRKFMQLKSIISEQPLVTVTYFVPDSKKAGGKYITVRKRLKKTDEIYRRLYFTDRTEINAEDILDIEL